MKTRITALALIVALPAVAADSAAPVVVELAVACASIQDASQRLACFDSMIAAVQTPPATVAAPVNAPAPAAGAPQIEKPVQVPEEAATVQARIVESRKSGGGLYVITLDNGQVWRHESGSMEPYLKAGEAVTISKGALGSHRLTLDSSKSKNWVRVTRVR